MDNSPGLSKDIRKANSMLARAIKNEFRLKWTTPNEACLWEAGLRPLEDEVANRKDKLKAAVL